MKYISSPSLPLHWRYFATETSTEHSYAVKPASSTFAGNSCRPFAKMHFKNLAALVSTYGILAYAIPLPSTASVAASAIPPVGSTLPGASTPVPACTQASPCKGSVSYYTPSGFGACGQSNSPSDPVISLSSKMMGSLSDGNPKNPLCGQRVTVKSINGGNTVTATVVDKCLSCVWCNCVTLLTC